MTSDVAAVGQARGPHGAAMPTRGASSAASHDEAPPSATADTITLSDDVHDEDSGESRSWLAGAIAGDAEPAAKADTQPPATFQTVIGGAPQPDTAQALLRPFTPVDPATSSQETYTPGDAKAATQPGLSLDMRDPSQARGQLQSEIQAQQSGKDGSRQKGAEAQGSLDRLSQAHDGLHADRQGADRALFGKRADVGEAQQQAEQATGSIHAQSDHLEQVVDQGDQANQALERSQQAIEEGQAAVDQASQQVSDARQQADEARQQAQQAETRVQTAESAPPAGNGNSKGQAEPASGNGQGAGNSKGNGQAAGNSQAAGNGQGRQQAAAAARREAQVRAAEAAAEQARQRTDQAEQRAQAAAQREQAAKQQLSQAQQAESDGRKGLADLQQHLDQALHARRQTQDQLGKNQAVLHQDLDQVKNLTAQSQRIDDQTGHNLASQQRARASLDQNQANEKVADRNLERLRGVLGEVEGKGGHDDPRRASPPPTVASADATSPLSRPGDDGDASSGVQRQGDRTYIRLDSLGSMTDSLGGGADGQVGKQRSRTPGQDDLGGAALAAASSDAASATGSHTLGEGGTSHGASQGQGHGLALGHGNGNGNGLGHRK